MPYERRAEPRHTATASSNSAAPRVRGLVDPRLFEGGPGGKGKGLTDGRTRALDSVGKGVGERIVYTSMVDMGGNTDGNPKGGHSEG